MGHNSHISVEFLEHFSVFILLVLNNKFRAHDIIPLCLSPHTTHYLHPRRAGMFSPLENAYMKELEARNKVGEVEVDKMDFWNSLKEAWEDTVSGVKGHVGLECNRIVSF